MIRNNQNTDTRATHVLLWLTGIIIVLIVLIFPAGYYFLSRQYMAGSLEAEAEINARIINQIISENPDMWQFEQVRLQEYLSRRARKGYAETRRVLDLKNRVIAESADIMAPPVMARSVKLFDSGTAVGRIEIARSLRPLLLRSGGIAFALLPLGVLAFLILYRLPIRNIQRSEEALRKERDKAQKYLNVAGVILLVLDKDQHVTLINKKGIQLLGRPEQEIIGKCWIDHFISEKFREDTRGAYSGLISGDVKQPYYFENRIVNAQREERIIAWYNTVLTDDAGAAAGTLSSGEDITDRKRLEDQLRHAQKMEAVGQLAGGVAHDFNNILSAIMGYGSLLQMKMKDNDPMRFNVDQILASSERAARLVQGLLAYSRKQILNPRPINVNAVVQNIAKLLHRLIGEDVELKIILSPEPAAVMADSIQIEQVLMNLATNARDAMPKGGSLIIKTSIETRKKDGAVFEENAPQYVVISVSDTGSGMDEKTKQKIFDPFFTTKEVGKGTGLGLAVVYGIVKQHDGDITVYSEPGHGTTFKIYFSLISAPPGESKGSETVVPPGGTETLLLAEDDASVRSITRSMLENFGYVVIEAEDGEEAVQKFLGNRDNVRLVILDVILPKKNGKTAHDEMKKIQPEIKALFMSGYTADIVQTRGILGEETDFISKPTPPQELLRKVREVLDRKS